MVNKPSINITLPPEIEERLLREAAEKGISFGEHLAAILNAETAKQLELAGGDVDYAAVRLLEDICETPVVKH